MRLVLNVLARRMIPCTVYPFSSRNSAKYDPSCKAKISNWNNCTFKRLEYKLPHEKTIRVCPPDRWCRLSMLSSMGRRYHLNFLTADYWPYRVCVYQMVFRLFSYLSARTLCPVNSYNWFDLCVKSRYGFVAIQYSNRCGTKQKNLIMKTTITTPLNCWQFHCFQIDSLVKMIHSTKFNWIGARMYACIAGCDNEFATEYCTRKQPISISLHSILTELNSSDLTF